MKKYIIAIFVFTFLFCGLCSAKPVYTPQTRSAIAMYKNRNYTECLQVMHEVVQKDPSNVLAYYYIAICQARLGDMTKAKEAYQRVIDLNSSTQLTNLSKNGIECLDDKTKCRSAYDLDPTKKAMDSINKQLEEQRINTVKDMVNRNQNVQDVPVKYMQDFKDYSLQKNQLQNKSELPTKDEVANALDVLRRAGYQNYMPQPAMTPEMMQMSMLNSLSPSTNNNNYNPMNFMPYMANYQNQKGNSQIDAQMMQTMMMTSMLDNMYDMNSSNK